MFKGHTTNITDIDMVFDGHIRQCKGVIAADFDEGYWW